MTNPTKLVISTVTLSAVMVIAAVAQRTYRTSPPSSHVLTPVGEGTRERKVFGEEPAAPSVSSAPAPPAVAAPASSAGDVPASILGFLERWKTSMAKADVDSHVRAYAPSLERYLKRGRVSRDHVRREREQMFRIYPSVNRFEIRDVSLESLRKDRAVVTFTKDWDISGVRRSAGSERQRLTLRETSGGWQIVREEDLKTYWVRR